MNPRLLLLLLLPLATIGNAALWIVFWNRIQSTMMPAWILDLLAHLAKLSCLVIPIGIALALVQRQGTAAWWFAFGYSACCVLVALVGIPLAFARRQTHRIDRLKTSTSSWTINGTEARTRSLGRAPTLLRPILRAAANQTFELEVNEKEVLLERLPTAIDGLSLAHLSDLHFTGHVAKRYFDDAVDIINDMDADMVAITGDLVDRKECMGWIPSTLGRLKARQGVYVILGNHDCKHNLPNLRLTLAESGLIHLGGRLHVVRLRGVDIVLAGNELPWIPPAPDMSLCPARGMLPQVRILLGHTPDQMDWARHFDFDLMLSGHTHGGQFRLPWFGPVVCPSRLPLGYAAGMFYNPPTTLHVSRGLSGQFPLRLNCRPEVTKLALRCAQQTSPSGTAALQATCESRDATMHGQDGLFREPLLVRDGSTREFTERL